MSGSVLDASFAKTDEELRQILAEAEIAPLVPAVAQVTGDYSLLREDLRPDPLLVLEPEGGITEGRLAVLRELLLGALARYRDGGCRPAPDPTQDELRRLMAYLVGDDEPRRGVLRRAERGAGGRRRGSPRARVAQGRHRPADAVHRRDHRRRDVGHPRRAPPPAGRRADRDPREERRRRRHLVREHLSGLPCRRRQPPLQLLVRPARLAAALLRPGDAARSLPPVRRRVRAARRTSASRRRSSTRSTSSTTARRGRVHVRNADGNDGDARGPGRGQRRRPAQPPERPRHRGPRRVRRPGVPLGALGSRRRPARQARRRHRHRRQRRAVDPDRRRAGGASSSCSSARRTGCSTRRSTTTTWPTGIAGCCDHVPSYTQWSRLWLFWRTHEGLLPAARVDPEWAAAGPVGQRAQRDGPRAADRVPERPSSPATPS